MEVTMVCTPNIFQSCLESVSNKGGMCYGSLRNLSREYSQQSGDCSIHNNP